MNRTAPVQVAIAVTIVSLACASCYVKYRRDAQGNLVKAEEEEKPRAAAPDWNLHERDVPLFRVVGAPTGDTLVLADGRRIRYTGVLAPAPSEPFFADSRRANRELVLGRKVHLLWDKRTRLGEHHLAYVVIPAVQTAPSRAYENRYIFANAALIGSGSARATYHAPNERYQDYFYQLEYRAKRRGIGIWQIGAASRPGGGE